MRRGKGVSSPSVDEMLATLNHSSLATVVIEGDNDLLVLRAMEDEFSSIGLSLLPAGGREKVLGIFDRRHELTNPKNIFFLVDKDVWSVLGIPPAYASDSAIALTDGYSIENDAYIDGNFERLLDARERTAFAKEIGVFVDWYAVALARSLNGVECRFAMHPNPVLDNHEDRQAFCKMQDGEQFPEELRARIWGDYRRLLRGKSLVAILMRHLSYKGRPARHQSDALLELAGKTRGRLLNRIFECVACYFGLDSSGAEGNMMRV